MKKSYDLQNNSNHKRKSESLSGSNAANDESKVMLLNQSIRDEKQGSSKAIL